MTDARLPDSAGPTFDDVFRRQLDELFAWRRDVRHFSREPVPAGLLADLFELACLAPSVGLSQPWRFVIVDDPSRRAAIRADFEACNARALADQSQERAASYARLKLAGLDQAPSQFAIFADPEPAQGKRLGRETMPDTTTYSAVMAAHTLWLAARAVNLGLGWVSILNPAAIAETLDIPAHWTFIGYFCLGFLLAEDDTPELERAGWERRQNAGSRILHR
ncbi:5,6-dimethylbenzimidazole synthase [Lichenicola cladoniae]|uniref:5,6-dimethylbenzimidazole synthase n=1 Tax=Lichenicola cladoniae TaxID=1484109 RepID=A0A6M8HTH3_9PROT|nr:5,6-dimethylbenzimidazole synthase [Lichenicola cladoniae]NPD67697.1 5,6-dimethylbenzimidazole synthase [Acetobacteraceae bacterium]QKE91632.1 5,6-dimethylbenzimidazole synthase [Lichenicola cladoniae]